MTFQLPIFSLSPELIRYLIISLVASFIATFLTNIALAQTDNLAESAKEFVVRSAIFYVLFFFIFLIVLPAIELVLESGLFGLAIGNFCTSLCNSF